MTITIDIQKTGDIEKGSIDDLVRQANTLAQTLIINKSGDSHNVTITTPSATASVVVAQ